VSLSPICAPADNGELATITVIVSTPVLCVYDTPVTDPTTSTPPRALRNQGDRSRVGREIVAEVMRPSFLAEKKRRRSYPQPFPPTKINSIEAVATSRRCPVASTTLTDSAVTSPQTPDTTPPGVRTVTK
jgi:hypothetical protein